MVSLLKLVIESIDLRDPGASSSEAVLFHADTNPVLSEEIEYTKYDRIFGFRSKERSPSTIIRENI